MDFKDYQGAQNFTYQCQGETLISCMVSIDSHGTYI